MDAIDLVQKLGQHSAQALIIWGDCVRRAEKYPNDINKKLAEAAGADVMRIAVGLSEQLGEKIR